jgi:hypothetical protein
MNGAERAMKRAERAMKRAKRAMRRAEEGFREGERAMGASKCTMRDAEQAIAAGEVAASGAEPRPSHRRHGRPLSRSVKTIETYRSRIKQKLGPKNPIELAQVAWRFVNGRAGGSTQIHSRPL